MNHGGVPLRRLLLGVFLVSAATLHLEILETRIFSLVLWHHVTYLVVTFTLLGFAASGTLLSLLGDRVERAPGRWLAGTALLFALTSVGAFTVLAHSKLDTLTLLQDRVQYLWVFAYYVYLVTPFVFAGLSIGVALKLAGPHTGAVYGANLAGSALGCLLFAPVLTWLGGPGSVLLPCALAAAGAFALAGGRGRLAVASAVVALLFGGLSLSSRGSAALLPFEAAPSKPLPQHLELARKTNPAARLETTRWDPICRVNVVDLGDRSGARRVFQDGDAPTEIFPAAQAFDPTSDYCLPYTILNAGGAAAAAPAVPAVERPAAPGPDVLVIGVGGGQDLRQAVWNGARRVIGIEINRATAEMMRTTYKEFSGSVYDQPNVHVEVGEGRSWLRRSEEQFDLIQMTGTDTYTALASGSYVLSESYLYTLDAFADYFDHLNDDGFVSVLRFRFFPPGEALRLVAIGAEALKRRGIAHPERHILVVDKVHWMPLPGEPGKLDRISFALMMFKMTPLVPEEIAAAKRWIEFNPLNAGRNADTRVYSLAYAPGEPTTTEFGSYLEAFAAGSTAEWERKYPYVVSPVDDDSPFFFHFHRWSSLLEAPQRTNYVSMIGRDPIGLFLLLTALAESVVLVVLLVLLPLLLSKRTRLPRERRGPVLLYFLGLGGGYLLLEVAAMQQFVLYLGHPSRSISVVLFSFLLFSGLGAAVAGRWRLRSAKVPLMLVVLLTAAAAFALPAILQATLGLETWPRILVSSALLAPLAFLMGMPFPVGLSRLDGAAKPFLPWALAINGGASVLASVVGILIAMGSGFTAVFVAAAACYVIAWLVSGRLPAATGGSASAPAA